MVSCVIYNPQYIIGVMLKKSFIHILFFQIIYHFFNIFEDFYESIQIFDVLSSGQ
jgi:hypothetical protein